MNCFSFGGRVSTAILTSSLALGLLPALTAAQATPETSPAAVSASTVSEFASPGDQVFPEGVAYDMAMGEFYIGSTTDGTIYRGNLATGEVEVFSPGGDDGRTTAIGMKVDEDGLLYVAGGATGTVFVYNTRDGNFLGAFANELGEGETFLNDIALSGDGTAYVTDPVSPVVFRVPGFTSGLSTVGGTPPANMNLETTVELSGTPAEYTEGFNFNGIVATDDGADLIAVKSNTGQLFRISLDGFEITEIDLGGQALKARWPRLGRPDTLRGPQHARVDSSSRAGGQFLEWRDGRGFYRRVTSLPDNNRASQLVLPGRQLSIRPARERSGVAVHGGRDRDSWRGDGVA